jgi:hypothetical protein
MHQHLGSVFRAEVSDAETIDLRLTNVAKVMESQAAKLKRNPFSLLFAGPSAPFLEQKIYRLRHPQFGEPLDIFLVPISRTADGFIYEAVFS